MTGEDKVFRRRGGLLSAGVLLLVLLGAAWWLAAATGAALFPVPAALAPQALDVQRPQYLDRHGLPLSTTYDNPWNVGDWLALHEIPPLLQQAFLASEDRRFYRHHGGDWLARGHALIQNLRSLRAVRGASTITEQVVRILHPRPRTLWSRWLEGIEAAQLERRFSKAEILEFYLNQVPYARQRRGVRQAARLYYDRDLYTLDPVEMLTLAAAIRAPGRMEPGRGDDRLHQAVRRLADYLVDSGTIPASAIGDPAAGGVRPPEWRLPVDAGHFLRQLTRFDGRVQPRVLTTLDAALQRDIQQMIEQSLADIGDRGLVDGAALVVDHQTDEVLAWVNGGGLATALPGGWIDAVTTPRQPGSTLKPFLYGLALERGWTASTIIDDSPLARPIGSGIHPFRNYSRRHYGPLRLREALGNSLNIPAVRTVQALGVEDFLARLHDLGFASLSRSANHYGEGLALGNGEITLFELVQAYAVLARSGLARPLRFTLDGRRNAAAPTGRIYSAEAASLIADILADPQARQLEFGHGNILRMPVQTAVKTGTSNDHRDAWAVGFNHRYTVGIWMGNLDRRPTDGVTGTTGPGLALRSVFARLNRSEEAAPLFLSPRLLTVEICRESGRRAGPGCPRIRERYLPGKGPGSVCRRHGGSSPAGGGEADGGDIAFRLVRPTPNLQMVMDPRIPDTVEAYPLRIAGAGRIERVEWLVDGSVIGTSGAGERHFMWPLARGGHLAQARIWTAGTTTGLTTTAVRFEVK